MGIVILIAIGIGIVPLCKGIKHLFEEIIEAERDSMDVEKNVRRRLKMTGLKDKDIDRLMRDF